MCAFNRPGILISCLESLRENNLTGWNLYISREPGCEEVRDIVEHITFMPVISWVNGIRLGVDLNTFVSYMVPFNNGATAVLHIEDDIILSPDAVELCNWYLDNPLSSGPDEAGLCLCNKGEENNPDLPNNVMSLGSTWIGLTGQGYCITYPQWKDFASQNFWVHKKHYGGRSWDWAITHAAIDHKKRILRPRLSRSQHAAAGVHGNVPGVIFPDVISQQPDTKFILE